MNFSTLIMKRTEGNAEICDRNLGARSQASGLKITISNLSQATALERLLKVTADFCLLRICAHVEVTKAISASALLE